MNLFFIFFYSSGIIPKRLYKKLSASVNDSLIFSFDFNINREASGTRRKFVQYWQMKASHSGIFFASFFKKIHFP